MYKIFPEVVMKKTAILPFTIKRTPVEKILLVNFDKDPDTLYTALELQFLNGAPYGKGYRILAYRNDQYIDVYDDDCLTFQPKESFSVASKGLGDHLVVSIKHTKFALHENALVASFEFLDKLNRMISVHIVEHSKRPTHPLSLLAPIGTSSVSPSFFPLFLLYDFDFVRKQDTDISISIDGHRKKPDSFPVPFPKDLQMRYFTRYSMDSHLFEFAPNESQPLSLIHLNDKNQAKVGPLTYSFTKYGKDNHLATITYHEKQYFFTTTFSPGLPDFSHLIENNTYTGKIRIGGNPSAGLILGHYSVKLVNQHINLVMRFHDGWLPSNDSRFSKLMLRKNSVFCTWPKSYEYHQVVDLSKHTSKSKWHRI